ncbi:hypothetical protein TcWFU_009779 [Taenia crassiceps]|uniref:Rab9 effector protein with kelch motifs n=1 Tax=Taenia crassiceps TaxID=6207 RepID=A0ABR4QF84_9CEST
MEIDEANFIINELILEYMKFNNLQFSESVFRSEMKHKHEPMSRRLLCQSLNVKPAVSARIPMDDSKPHSVAGVPPFAEKPVPLLLFDFVAAHRQISSRLLPVHIDAFLAIGFHRWGYVLKCDMLNVGKGAALARVGHTAHHLHTDDGLDWLLLLGGADSSSCCKNSLLYSIRNGHVHLIETPDSLSEPGFERYEHASVLLDNELVIFGGATAVRPLNDVIHAKLEMKVSASSPGCLFDSSVSTTTTTDVAPRTQHTAACLTYTDELVVFAGGDRGSAPVEDQKVHLYEVKTRRWRVIEVRNESEAPCFRMGHLMLPLPPPLPSQDLHPVTTTTLYVHGGMAGSNFFDDLFCLSIERVLRKDETHVIGEWQNIRAAVTQEGPWPSPRAGHGGAFIRSSTSSSSSRFFIFGGVNAGGTLNDLQYFDTESTQWTTVMPSQGEVPRPRLDFAFTTVRLKVPCRELILQSALDSKDLSTEKKQVEESLVWRNFLFIHGGMDAGREIFHDAYFCCLNDA